MVEVYSKDNCIQCDATARELERKGIAFEKIDIMKDADAYAKITGLGYKQVPVVIAGDDHWAGFRPDKIGALAA